VRCNQCSAAIVLGWMGDAALTVSAALMTYDTLELFYHQVFFYSSPPFLSCARYISGLALHLGIQLLCVGSLGQRRAPVFELCLRF
jgi:hypothetical protein